MLKAKLDSVRKNKKGFSLVELIIVIAIMVALIAVMAPAFVKYVQKSRNSALSTAAESLYTAMQTYYSDPDEAPGAGGVTFVVSASGNSAISIVNGSGDEVEAGTDSDAAKIVKLAGVDTSKKMGKATNSFTMTATQSGTDWIFTFTESSGN